MDGSWWRVLTKCGLLEQGMTNHFSIPALRIPWTVWKSKKIGHLNNELPRSVGAQYATGDQWRNNSRKNEEMEPKQKQHPVVDVTGDGSKVWCCKEQYCIGTWNVRSTNQGKLEAIKQEMTRMSVNILGISFFSVTGWGIDLDYRDIEWFAWRRTEIILLFLRLHSSTTFWILFDYGGNSISSKGFLPTVVDIMVIWVKFTHSSPF